ncbi:MAG: ATP-binding protein, partial [Verrucomicrobiota bacterium]
VYFGMIAGATFGNYQAGYRFGKLAYDLTDRGFLVWKSRVLVIFGNVINFWTQHMRSDIPYLHAAFTAGLELGDIACACYSCNHLITAMLAVGFPLNEVLTELQKRLAFVRKAHYDDVADLLVSQQRFILNMQGRTTSFSSFSDAGFDEAAFEEKIAKSQMALLPFWHDVLKLQARVLSGDVEQALVIGKRAEALLWTSPNHIEVTQFHFFYGLALAAAHDRAPEGEREELRKTLETYCAKLRDWAANCPENFQHKHALLAAECARLTRLPEAEELFKSAILLARETGFIQNEGIANELAARFYLERGLETIGHACLREARNCYVRWDAEGKVRQLEARYPWLAEERPVEVAAGTFATPPEQLDLLAVIKQQHAISGEILPERLAETLLRIVLESAGAQKAYLFVAPDAELLAEIQPGPGELSVKFNRAPPSGGPCVAGSILNYVKRSRETVILRDASSDAGVFSTDEYLQRAKPKSVFCMPISRGAKLFGVLYLENNLAPDAFTPARHSMLKMIGSQAAISLETATIYSDLQRSEGDLQSQTRILRSILESMGDGVVVANERGEFLLFNPAAEEILGVGANSGGLESLAQQAGLYLPDQVTPYPPMELPLAKAIRKGEWVREAEIFVRHSKRPQGVWLSVSASPLRSENGPIYGGVTVLTDITGRREVERNLRIAKEAAEAANRTKDQFLAMLSHELRTPLTPILGGINILEEEATPELRETLEMMRRNLMLETRLIDDLLDLNSIAKGKLQLQLKPMDAHQAVLGAIETCRQQLSNHQVTLALDASEHFVNGDSNRMEQIVRNLLLNAVRFTPSGGMIELRTTNPAPGTFQFSCRDNGQGIKRGDLARIFNAFEQVGRFVKQGYGGLGLGLAISKALMEAQGGTIAAHSPGRDAGSTFEIALDSLPVAGAPPSPGDSAKPSSTKSPPRPSTSTQAPLHILLIEDHLETRETLARLLQRYGYQVDTAQDAKTAREKAGRKPFDLFISDIGLPDGSGYDLIQTLRKRHPVPAISLSGFGMESDFQKSRAVGFSEHLVKPLDFKLLRATIERLRGCVTTPANPHDAAHMDGALK